MSRNTDIEQVGIVNLRHLKGIVISEGRLQVPLEPKLAKRHKNFKPPVNRVVFINGDYIVGHGRVTDIWDHFSDHDNKEVVLFDIQPSKTYRQVLSSVQLAAMKAYLKQYAVSRKQLTGVMPLASEMCSLFPEATQHEPVLLGMYTEQWLRTERQAIHDDESLGQDDKLHLLQGLDACGRHADDVWALHTTLCAEGAQDFEPYPILPWEECTTEQRLDPHNWVLLPSALASHFKMGLLTFSDNGGLIRSKALTYDLDQFDVYYDYTLYTLTERQRVYMKVHRKQIFDSWRTNPPWLSR